MRLRGNPQSTLPLLRQRSCQGHNKFLPVPQGCQIAPDTADSRFVVGNYNWNTLVVLLDSGKPRCTKHWVSSSKGRCKEGAGGIFDNPNSVWLKSSNNRHAVLHCQSQILVQCPGSCFRPHLSFFLSLLHTISLVKSHLKRHNTQTHFKRDCAVNDTNNNTNTTTYVSLVSGKAPKPPAGGIFTKG